MKINLHMHTTCSDGAFPKEELSSLIKKENLDLFSITDHDTVEANAFFQKEFPNTFVSGVELSVCCPDIKKDTLHLLIYDFDIDKMKVELEKLALKRKENAYIVQDLLKKDGFNVTLENDRDEFKRQLAILLVDAGYCADRESACINILNKYSEYFVNPSIQEAFEIVKVTGGKTSWAHPFNIIIDTKKVFIDKNRLENILSHLIKEDMDSIEANYLTFSEAQQEYLRTLATNNNLLVSCGTDFHRNPTPLFYEIDKSKVTLLNIIKKS